MTKADGHRSKCPGHGRHWFTVYGRPTQRTHRCLRCGAPNPKWDQIEEVQCFQFGAFEVGQLIDALNRRFDG